ncbi:MAG TPA: hypothetical protein VFV99_31650 [Kofleriaceae bacterium]|nr:hypothetical protein [Kofleriaceae bacterium]
MRKLIATTLIALPALAYAEKKDSVIEMPPDQVRTVTNVATVDDAIDSTAPTPAVTDKAPEPAEPVVEKKKDKWIEPYIAIAGGMRLESLHQPDTVDRGTQNPTVAVSRLGLRGGVGEHISFASEFEASLGGPLGYGASVWEGQAAIAIRDQWVRYKRSGFAIAAGRIADPASFDYTSKHVADLLLTDLYTRDPLLYSGADRGNGIIATYDVNQHLTLGGTFHSTNPTGITGTLIIGGKLQPFDRPFYLASSAVGNNQNNLPDQNLHIYFGSPSARLHFDNFEVQSEVQVYTLDTQQAIMDDQTIRGYNLRLGGKAWLETPQGRLTGFANVSRNKNEILDPVDSKYRLPDLFHSYTVSAGVDYDYKKNNGIGFQYAMVDTTEPDLHTRLHFINLATTYWIEDSLAIALRGSVYAQQISGEMMTTGSRSLFLTAKLLLN